MFNFHTKKKFFAAARAGDIDTLRQYLADKDNWGQVKDKATGDTALHIAAARSDIAMAKLLLDKYPDPCVTNNEYEMPLHLAAAQGCVELVRLLIPRSKSYVNYSSKGATPFQSAIAGGHVEVMKALLETGSINLHHPPAMHYAASTGKIESLKFLLSIGADPNVPLITQRYSYDDDDYFDYHRSRKTEESRESPLQCAARYNHTDAALALLAAGGKAGEKGELPLIHAAENGNMQLAEALIAHGANVNARAENGQSALHLAATKNQAGLVRLLLANGAQRDMKDKDGRTPLSLAQQYALTEIVDILKGPEVPQVLKPVAAVAAPDPKPVPASPVAPRPQTDRPAEEDFESWKLSGQKKLLHVSTFGSLNRRLTEIFNFETRERMVISENLALKTETMGAPESLDALTDEALGKAWQEFTRLGGKADETAVFGQRMMKTKLKAG
jgi:ankyrin repeat protein